MTAVSYSQRFSSLAAANADRPMITVVSALGEDETSISWCAAERSANRMARALAHDGVALGDYVTIALPNGVEFILACMAAWKLGAVPQPVSSRLPAPELDAIVALADSRAVLGVDVGRYPGRACWPVDFQLDPALDDGPIPEDRVAPAWKAPTSGGSTGRPKLIVSSDPSTFDPEEPGLLGVLGIEPDCTTVMPGPLYHNGPFIWVFAQLLMGGHAVVLRRFDASVTLDAVARHGASSLYLVPTMMSRIWKLPEVVRGRFRLDSLKRVWHLAAPCPQWLKRAWIDWLGPDRLWELYGGTEAQAATVLDGNEWLAHPGSVGRTVAGEIRIVDDSGAEAPAGIVGEVFMRPDPGRVTYFYKGAKAKGIDGGWESLGDMGHVDEDGYLYLCDRRTDMILSGGANIYPAEIEAVIDAHPQVRSSVVIGLPDEDLGQRVHAIVEAEGLSAQALIDHVAATLVRYKVPRTLEFVDQALRDDAGKVRRAAMRAQRTGG